MKKKKNNKSYFIKVFYSFLTVTGLSLMLISCGEGIVKLISLLI